MGLMPLVILVAVVGAFLAGDPIALFTEEVPPIEELALQRLVIDDEGFRVNVINIGPDPISIAQIQVDGAYWHYSFEAGNPVLDRLDTASLRIPYP